MPSSRPADGREPDVERRELAGEQREQAVAEQVDPVERVPGVLAQLGLGEPRRLELADQQVAIDRLVAGAGRSCARERRRASGR